MNILAKIIKPGGRLPTRATSGSAGMDLFALCDQDVVVNPGERKKVGTGISISLPSNDVAAFIFARSGLSFNHGICLSNAVGVIDSDYRGEILVAVLNSSKNSYTIKNGDRIAQMIVMPVVNANIVLSDKLDLTKRGDGGFGSTG